MNIEQVRTAVDHRRRRHRVFIAAFSAFTGVYLLLSCLYFLTPYSRVDSVEIHGRHYYEAADIKKLVFNKHLSGNTYLPTFNEEKYADVIAKAAINSFESLVSAVSVQVKMFSLEVDYRDVLPIFLYHERIYLANGDVMPELASMPKFRFSYDDTSYRGIEDYILSLPEFIVAAGLSFDSKHDSAGFTASEPLSLKRISYIYKVSDNVYYLYEYSQALSERYNYDVYIRYNIAQTSAGNFLREELISSTSSYIEGNSTNIIQDDDCLGQPLKVINCDITTNGDRQNGHSDL